MRPTLSFRQACVAAVAYADIFAYPLSGQELREWMIHYVAGSRRILGIPKTRLGNTVFFQLRQDKLAVYRRFQRASWTRGKWKIAKRVAQFLSLIPSIQFIGVTGGVAMNNAAKDDDIDLLLVTAPETLWITRLFATVLLDALSLRRKPGENHVDNKICLNMFMSADDLVIPSYEQDLFVAHELLQMVAVFDRGSLYQQLLKTNRWARVFLPKAWAKRVKSSKGKVKNERTKIVTFAIRYSLFVIRVLEKPSKLVQLWYMKRHRTREVITDSMIRFHPRDARVWIKRKLAARLRRFHIPLDRIFYAS